MIVSGSKDELVKLQKTKQQQQRSPIFTYLFIQTTQTTEELKG